MLITEELWLFGKTENGQKYSKYTIQIQIQIMFGEDRVMVMPNLLDLITIPPPALLSRGLRG